MPETDLSPDCSQCDALCCVLLAFDASDAFAANKPACAPCNHLSADNRCRIHPVLTGQGFAGCAAYTCHGAGQRITGQVFAGRSWRNDPTLLPAMEDAFRALRRLHEAAWLLHEAGRLALPARQDQQRKQLLATLNLGHAWSEDSLRAAEQGPALRAVLPFLASLRAVMPRRR